MKKINNFWKNFRKEKITSVWFPLIGFLLGILILFLMMKFGG